MLVCLFWFIYGDIFMVVNFVVCWWWMIMLIVFIMYSFVYFDCVNYGFVVVVGIN